MKQVEKEVKMNKVQEDGTKKQEVVELVSVDVCESQEDVTEAFSWPEIIAMVNAQNTANICNKARASHREKAAGKGKRYEVAFNSLPGITFEDGQSGIEKLNAALSSSDNPKAALDALLASPEVQKVVDEKLAATAA